MRRNLIFAILQLSLFTLSAQILTEWDDVSITHLNRERAHTLEMPFVGVNEVNNAATPTEAYEASAGVLSLNGRWKFQWVGTPDEAPATFMEDDFDAAAWDEIDVPSSWQTYGIWHGKQWDKPLYVNQLYPFSYDPATWSVMAERPAGYTYSGAMKNPVASYRREFTLPADWQGRDVMLRFNGAGHGYYVWVNGQFVGYAEDSYLPSEWNITNKVRAGVNNIAVRVYRFTSGSFLECQDYWRLTGITRDVFLWAAPKTRIQDFFCRTTELTADNTAAQVALTTELAGRLPKRSALHARILDGEKVVCEDILMLQTAKGEQTLKASGITPWSAELPKLYTLELTLTDESGKQPIVLDQRVSKIGFRTVGVREDGALLVNGNRVIFHGVDRHDFSPTGGRTVTKAEMLADLLQMKRLNINAIRTSHYPNNPYFYDLCDQLGFYLIAEADVECHGNLNLSHEEAFRQPMAERNVRQVLTLRNHVCICLWSAGNESGDGDNFQTAADSIRALDPTRLRHYQGNSQWSDVTSTMYAGSEWMHDTGQQRLDAYQKGYNNIQPHIQCENTHAMGNSMGNQREFFDQYEKYPALTGEFIWDWKDQGLAVPSRTSYYYGGDFGDYPNDNNFCCNGVVLADGTPTAKSYNAKKIYQPLDVMMKDSLRGVFTFKSKLQQRMLDDLDVHYTILEDGMPVDSGALQRMVLAPGETCDVTLPPFTLPNPEAEYFVRFSARQRQATPWAEAGYEVAAEQFRIRDFLSRKPYQPAEAGKLKVQKTDSGYNVTGDAFKAVFADGLLSSYRTHAADGTDRDLLCAPLSFQVFRVPTDNEMYIQHWDAMGLRDLKMTAGQWEMKKGKKGKSIELAVTNRYDCKDGNYFTVRQLFTVHADGTILVTTDANPSFADVELPRLGLRTELPTGTETLRWMGRGPWENYRDRKECCFPGLYTSSVSEQWTNYVKPQETGNKEEVRWLAVTDAEGRGMLFVAPEQMAATAGHWRAEDIYTDKAHRIMHPDEVPFCQTTVVSLDAYNRALGNASCGPDVLPKYRRLASRTQFSLVLMPLGQPLTDATLVEKARVAAPRSSAVNIQTERGIVALSTCFPKATIHYSINGGQWQEYSQPVNMRQGGTIRAYSSCEGMEHGLENETVVDYWLDKSSWKILSVSSEQSEGEGAARTIDGNPFTFWHTPYFPTVTPCPHEVVIDMSHAYQVAQFVYQGRSDSGNGRIKDYEVSFSNDPHTWGTPAITSTLLNTSAPQKVAVPGTPTARYMKLTVRSTHDNQGYATAAELGIMPVLNK